jgi:hypothetical protein
MITRDGTVTAGLETLPEYSSQRRGIGLAVVHALVKQLDGNLSISPTEGTSGTTFTLRIPVVSLDDKPLDYSKERNENRVLIVDDRHDVLAALTNICIRMGMQCDTASSAAMALNLLVVNSYGRVLIDLDMPGTSGEELALKIKSSRPALSR